MALTYTPYLPALAVHWLFALTLSLSVGGIWDAYCALAAGVFGLDVSRGRCALCSNPHPLGWLGAGTDWVGPIQRCCPSCALAAGACGLDVSRPRAYLLHPSPTPAQNRRLRACRASVARRNPRRAASPLIRRFPALAAARPPQVARSFDAPWLSTSFSDYWSRSVCRGLAMACVQVHSSNVYTYGGIKEPCARSKLRLWYSTDDAI